MLSVPLGDLSFVLPSVGHAVAQFAEDRDEAADFFERGRLGGNFERAAELRDALSHDLHFFVDGFRQGQHHGVEAALERAARVHSRLCRDRSRWR